jgi:hypothetical protein
MWPELYGVYFNVYEGKSSEWGVSCGFLLHILVSDSVCRHHLRMRIFFRTSLGFFLGPFH